MSLTVHIESNVAEVIAWLEARVPAQPVQEVTIDNDAPYALELHERSGYSVINERVLPDAVFESLDDRAELVAGKGDLLKDDDVAEGLEEAAISTLDWHHRVIGTKDRPGQYRPPPRPGHYESWASDSGTLINAWHYQVTGGERTNYPHPDISIIADRRGGGA